ncbi:hypothetical protein [Cupriavidus taiwanensis]|nr:hypothetical protein [Cupriavidus taiwanensis]SPA44623.1 hypothetical protein CBM2629_A150425 [Cupriavidus taiwanensis]
MYPINAILAGWLSLWLAPLPEFDYWSHALEGVRCKAIPEIAGW